MTITGSLIKPLLCYWTTQTTYIPPFIKCEYVFISLGKFLHLSWIWNILEFQATQFSRLLRFLLNTQHMSAMPADCLTVLRGRERRVPFPHPPWMRSLSSPLDNYERQGSFLLPLPLQWRAIKSICTKHGRPAFDKDYCCWIFSAPFPQTEIKLQLFMACFSPSCLIAIPSPVCNCAWMRVPRHPVIHPCMWFAECALQQRYRNLFIMKRQSEVSAEKFRFAKGRRNAQNHCRLRNLYSGWQGTDWWTGLPFSYGGKLLWLTPSHPEVRWRYIISSAITYPPSTMNFVSRWMCQTE